MSTAVRSRPNCLSAVFFIAAFGTASSAHAFSAGIASTQFGSLGCNTCHAGGNTPDVTLTGPTAVAPGSTNEYTLKIAVTGSQNKGGLNVAATDGTLAVGGSAAAQTQTISGAGGLAEITHAGAKPASGGFTTFSFLWTAPDPFTTETLNAWGNAVNGDATSGGDKAAFTSLDITAGVSPTPVPSACAAVPMSGCRKPVKSGASTFQLKFNANSSKNALTWTWSKGDTTALADFGDPTTSTDYTLCVYDGTSSVVMSTNAPAGGSWVATKKGFNYKNNSLTPDGLMQVQLTSGVAGKAKIQVKGKGANLPLPALPLNQSQAIVVQLVNTNGVCWDANYSSPAKKNDSSQFNDKSD